MLQFTLCTKSIDFSLPVDFLIHYGDLFKVPAEHIKYAKKAGTKISYRPFVLDISKIYF
jgi:hypothetical protein